MNGIPIMVTFEDIVFRGRMFQSPEECYSQNVHVMCDRCKRRGIKHFVHLNESDLCLPCVNDIEGWMNPQANKSDEPNFALTMMAQEQFQDISAMQRRQFQRPETLTYMMQDQFATEPCLTRMMQEQFKPMNQNDRSTSIGLVSKMKQRLFRQK